MQTDNVINDFPTKDNGPVAYLLFLILFSKIDYVQKLIFHLQKYYLQFHSENFSLRVAMRGLNIVLFW
jgi:hypothetical protein